MSGFVTRYSWIGSDRDVYAVLLGNFSLALGRSHFKPQRSPFELETPSFLLKRSHFELETCTSGLKTPSFLLKRSHFELETCSLELERSHFNPE
ncbi:hypothetical protein [Stenomitos frigidus]|uniref:Uncharacterized protein n=1 Tax=Stenomitos frigidus ULC18 TaxID=2107698 RepID=A0A2T1EBK2_9CYAN|nr:hypothetical protein [Stenomitos frigidus]PSB30073.1 hypothetical protein C7B82_09900 [Stenomitos frigidus ULC18]